MHHQLAYIYILKQRRLQNFGKMDTHQLHPALSLRRSEFHPLCHVTLPIEKHIKIMDAAGVDKTVLFSTTFHPEKAKNFAETKTSIKFLSNLLNGKVGAMVEQRKKSVFELAEAIHQYPSRYIGFGNVPIGLELEDTLKYVDEVIEKNHLAGMGEFTPGNGKISILNNIFKASQEFHHLPIWIHGEKKAQTAAPVHSSSFVDFLGQRLEVLPK